MRIGAHQKGGQLRIKDAHEAAEAQELRLHAPAVCVEIGLQRSKHTVNDIRGKIPGSYLLHSQYILKEDAVLLPQNKCGLGHLLWTQCGSSMWSNELAQTCSHVCQSQSRMKAPFLLKKCFTQHLFATGQGGAVHRKM